MGDLFAVDLFFSSLMFAIVISPVVVIGDILPRLKNVGFLLHRPYSIPVTLTGQFTEVSVSTGVNSAVPQPIFNALNRS